VDDGKRRTSRLSLRLMPSIRSRTLAPVAPNFLACSKTNTRQLQVVLCLGAHNQVKQTCGQQPKLLLLRHRKRQALGENRLRTCSALKLEPSRCDGDSIISRPLLHRILNLQLHLDMHSPPALPSMNLVPLTLLQHPQRANLHHGHGRGTDPPYQALGPRTAIPRPASCEADLRAIVPYRTALIRRSRRIRMPRRHRA